MECSLILRDENKIKRYQDWEFNSEIQLFREYLRIPSVHPDIDYSKFVTHAAVSCHASLILARRK